jgi:CMP/dCMP kinase
MSEKKHPKISVTGDLGSGKSTITYELSKRTGYKIYSTGSCQREVAKNHGMSTLELNKYAETHPEIDDEIDTITKELNNKKESFIIDSRMAWHFIKNSFKISLQVSPNIAAKRIIDDQQNRISEKVSNIKNTIKDLTARKESEDIRFKKLYNVNCSDNTNYDLIIDTSYSRVSEIVDIILQQFQNYIKGLVFHNHWISPKLLIPTQYIISLGRGDALQLIESIKNDGYDEKCPVSVVKYERFLFIWDGHKRVSATLFNNKTLIPINIEAKDNEEILPGLIVEQFIKTSIKKGWIYDWEECHKFIYDEYPMFC